MCLPAKILDSVVGERQDRSSIESVVNGSPASLPVDVYQMICLLLKLK